MKRTRIRSRNPARLKRLREAQYGPHADRIRSLPCLIGRDCHGTVEAAHVRSRGAGGKSSDLVPLCRGHHRELHDHGVRTWQCRYLIDLKAEARRLADGG